MKESLISKEKEIINNTADEKSLLKRMEKTTDEYYKEISEWRRSFIRVCGSYCNCPNCKTPSNNVSDIVEKAILTSKDDHFGRPRYNQNIKEYRNNLEQHDKDIFDSMWNDYIFNKTTSNR